MMKDIPLPVSVDFPLRGEWTAANTPAHRVPSHGTDQLAQRYAYDFVRIDRQAPGWKYYRSSVFHYFLLGARLEDCYGWGAPIYAPFPGVVTTAEDGEAERNPMHFLRDLAVVLGNAFTFNPDAGSHNLRRLLGNHIILRMDNAEIYGFFAHARRGSIRVRIGQRIQAGDLLAEVGHSGNSTAPHLHFHLMDGPDICRAQGVPCTFRQYEVLHSSEWAAVSNGLPARREFIRSVIQPTDAPTWPSPNPAVHTDAAR